VKEKWEKTKMNQAVQQKKVQSIVSQMQAPNVGSVPNLAATPQSSSIKLDNNIDKIKNLQNSTELVTFDDVSDTKQD
jgi:hypothetical protein